MFVAFPEDTLSWRTGLFLVGQDWSTLESSSHTASSLLSLCPGPWTWQWEASCWGALNFRELYHFRGPSLLLRSFQTSSFPVLTKSVVAAKNIIGLRSKDFAKPARVMCAPIILVLSLHYSVSSSLSYIASLCFVFKFYLIYFIVV